ncbi:hypothetical protein RRG08_040099 [Elysia crispata]|uniref:Uncharacterized protein n=1 Tax=Elysia crispata TaxID=231223 RepID=A0AAE1CN14_9GAST|nr:hypothetical protein RRG08_040099 [Elysia crispata]
MVLKGRDSLSEIEKYSSNIRFENSTPAGLLLLDVTRGCHASPAQSHNVERSRPPSPLPQTDACPWHRRLHKIFK